MVKCAYCNKEQQVTLILCYKNNDEVTAYLHSICSIIFPIHLLYIFAQFGEKCCDCGAKFASYYCGKCKHLTGTDDHPYHCEKCGICRFVIRISYGSSWYSFILAAYLENVKVIAGECFNNRQDLMLVNMMSSSQNR